jgi:hypothetical protein
MILYLMRKRTKQEFYEREHLLYGRSRFIDCEFSTILQLVDRSELSGAFFTDL